MIRYFSLAHCKKLTNSKEGLTSVITTVLIIAIVLGLIIGPYLTIIVPQQIKENEAAHLEEVDESFQNLRANINSEIKKGIPNAVLNTRIKLGTDDENLFVVGGSGNLKIDPSSSYVSVYDHDDPLSIYARGSGNIEYYTKNLYYTDKSYFYETGGVIVKQKSVSVMNIDPVFKLTRREVYRNFALDASFANLTSADTQLGNIYIINTNSTQLLFDSARVSWTGGNATGLTELNIGGNPVEWSGLQASGLTFNFLNTFTLGHGTETMTVDFNSDMRDSVITIELFTNNSKELEDSWPLTSLDTITHGYDIEVPAENAKKFSFKNICENDVTINRIALSWTGSAKLLKINIPGHGGDVWSTVFPGVSSPSNINLTIKPVFNPDEIDDVKCYFNGVIDDEELNIKFFVKNSTNLPIAYYPPNFNETYINNSLTIASLVTETGNRITTAGKSSKVIQTTLVSSEENRYLWEVGRSVVFEIITSNSDAWLDYLNNTFVSDSNLVWDQDGTGAFPGDYFIETTQVSDDQMKISVILNNIYKLDITLGVLSVDIG